MVTCGLLSPGEYWILTSPSQHVQYTALTSEVVLGCFAAEKITTSLGLPPKSARAPVAEETIVSNATSLGCPYW